jgi:3-methylcrotonyl-CoA carboxylase alpha subunit
MDARVNFSAAGIRASIDGTKSADCPVFAAGEKAIAWHHGRQTIVSLANAAAREEERAGSGEILAPMHGKVLSIDVKAGDRVKKGQVLAVIEAMKMEHALIAPMDGEVAEIAVTAGDQVSERARIALIKEYEEEKAVS